MTAWRRLIIGHVAVIETDECEVVGRITPAARRIAGVCAASGPLEKQQSAVIRADPIPGQRAIGRAGRGAKCQAILEGGVSRRCRARWRSGQGRRRQGGKCGGDQGRPPKHQTEKLVPQPQPEAALGLVTWKAAPPRLSTKSTTAPRTRSSEMGSTTRVTPSCSAFASSASTASARSNLYWKPAQPPPSTERRRIAGFAWRAAIAATRAAAEGERAMSLMSAK